jgi:UDP-GlcNAc:undecaprenyl-phosphate GlcNAc-1-phosphate transferase
VKAYGISFGLAFAGSLVLTFLVRQFARAFKLVAKPRADRWHRKPTALFGGIGIYGGFLLAYLLRRPAAAEGDALLVACASGMFVVGLIDDIVQLKPYAKLIGQFVFCAGITIFGMRLHWLPSEVLDRVLTVFWLVGITNALNLLDNLDGLAGGVAVIAAGFLIYFCHTADHPSTATLAAAFAGATAAFLVFNFNPASIFMGDCGSLFIGFFLGGVTMTASTGGIRRNVIAVLSIPVLVLLIPIVDTTLVTISRKLHGRPISQGGRDHTSHRLVALGLSERSAALLLWALAAASGIVAVMVQRFSWIVTVVIVPLFGLGLIFFTILIGRVRVYERVSSEAEGRGRALLPTLADFTYKRRVFEVLNDAIVIVVAYHAAFLLRFDGQHTQPFFQQFIIALPLVLGVQLTSFLLLGLYRGLWRYTSLADLSTQLRAVVGAWVATLVAIGLLTRFDGFSRGMLLIDLALLLLGVPGTRISFRLFRAWLARFQRGTDGKRVVIYGAGDAGELLLRELQNNRELGLIPVGFIDDDPQKHGRVIHGVRVLGPPAELSSLIEAQRVEEVVVSTTKVDAVRLEAVAEMCRSSGLGYRRMRIALD